MALRTINITTALIRNSLNESTSTIGGLVLSAQINKWSRYKPVRGTFPSASDGKYGLDPGNSWAYNKPRGAANSEPYRMGDFRGYEDDMNLTPPPVYISSPTGVPAYTTLKPSDAPTTGVWTFNMNTVHESIRIVPADLGLQNYYFGIKLVNPSGGTYYKTRTTALADGQTLGINVALSDPSIPSFTDCPYGVGTFTWTAFISSTSASAWTTTAPSNIINLPAGTFGNLASINTGTFVVTNWMQVSDNAHSWLDHESTYTDSKAIIIYTNTGMTRWYITNTTERPFPSWLSYRVYDETDAMDITASPQYWTDKCILKLFPTIDQDPGDPALSGDVFLNDGTDDLISLHVDQEAAPVRYAAMLSVWSGDTSGLTLTNASGYIDEGEQLLSLTFTPNITGTLYYRISFHGTYVGTGSITGCSSGVVKTAGVNANNVMDSGDAPVLVELSGDPII